MISLARSQIPKHRWRLLCVLSLAAAYLWGGYSASQNVFPFPELRAAKSMFIHQVGGSPTKLVVPLPVSPRFSMDALGRIVGDAHKVRVGCPLQGSRTAVFLLLGQSNAANSGGQRFRSAAAANVVNFHAGKCYLAESPLLGSTGFYGEFWTLLGNKLVVAKSFDNIVLVPATFAATEISQWVPGGRLHEAVRQTIVEMGEARYTATHVIWQHGESDYVGGTPKNIYADRLKYLIDTVRSGGISAPIFVSVASRCDPLRNFFADNSVQRAQRALPSVVAGVFAGVDTDTLLNDLDRYDDCHFSASGQHKVADAWFRILRNPIPGLPRSATWSGATGSTDPGSTPALP